MSKNEYVIVGDTKGRKGCLVAVCGADRTWAEKVLDRFLTNPTHNDIRSMEGHENLRIKEVPASECWWNDPFLMAD